MAIQTKTRAKALVYEGVLTPKGIQKALTTLEPTWAIPPLEKLGALVENIELLAGYVKKRESRQSKPRTIKPIRAALKLLHEAADRQARLIEAGELRYVLPDLETRDEARETEVLITLNSFLTWFRAEREALGSDAAGNIAVAFGEMPARGVMLSWHGKTRIWTPLLAASWHPPQGVHPLHARSSIVRVIHGLLIATGESNKTMACTHAAVCKFLRENKDLLKVR